jgi:hypothetical protein
MTTLDLLFPVVGTKLPDMCPAPNPSEGHSP